MKAVTLAIAVCAVGVGLAQEGKPSLQPTRCLPSDTIAYAEVPDFEASKARFKETAIYKIWAEPQVQEFAAPIKDFISRKFGEFEEKFLAEVGLPLDELYTAFSGQIAGALIRVNIPPPAKGNQPKQKSGPDVVEAALFLTPREPERVKALIAGLHGYIQKKNEDTIKVVDYGGISVTEICPKMDASDPTLAHAWLGSMFVIAIGPRKKTIQGVISRWRGQTQGLLCENEDFAATRKRGTRDHVDFFAYLNVDSLLKKLDAHIGPKIRPAFEAAGLYSVKAVCYNLTFDGPAFRDLIYVRTGARKEGFVKALSPASLGEGVLDQVPAGATMFAAMRFNPTVLWQTIDKFAASLGEKDYIKFRDAVSKANEFLEADIEKDIIPAFGDYAILYSQPSQMGPMMFGLLDLVAIIQTKDKTKAEVAGELLRQKTTELAVKQAQARGQAAVPFYWQSLPHGNLTIHYVTITAAPIPFLMPAYAIADDKVVIGLSLQAVQNTLNRLKAPGPSIRTRPDFAQVYPKVSKGAGAIFYSDVKANFPQTHAMLSTALTGIQVMVNVQQEIKADVAQAVLDAQQGKGKLIIDMTKFPPPDVFMKHLFGSVLVVKSEEAGIVMESYSPGNSVAGLGAGAGIIAAIAIPSLLHSRMAANEAATVGSLKTIATQQAIYKQQAEVDQDGDGVGEYGLLAELCGEVPPRPHKKEVVTPIYIHQQFGTGGLGGKGYAEKSGYCYRIYLPTGRTTVGDDKSLAGTPQQGGPPTTDPAAINLQEHHFVIYAWPMEANSTGQRAFFVNEVGEVYGTKMNQKTYSGENGPNIDAAFSRAGNGADGWFNDRIGEEGNDGNRWTPAG